MVAGFVINGGENRHESRQPTTDEDLVRALKVAPGGTRLHHAYRGGLWVMWTVNFLGEGAVSIISSRVAAASPATLPSRGRIMWLVP
jgi:hypothetical protein